MKKGNYILLVIALLTLVLGIFLPAITHMNPATCADPLFTSLPWKYSTTPNTIIGFDPPITADIDQDGWLDSLFLGGMKYGTIDTGIILRINSYTGEEIWRREKTRGSELNPLELYDINDDGVPELFSSWGDSGHPYQKGMICLNTVNGSTIWLNWDAMPAWHHFVIIADKTTNVPFIYFNGHNSTMNKMYATNGTIAKTISSGLSCNGGLSAADMENDGNVEIILSLHSPPGIVCYDTDLTKKWQANVDTNSSTQCGGLVDVTGDGVLDVVTLFQCNEGAHDAGITVVNGATGQKIDSMSNPHLGIDAHSQGSIVDYDNDGCYEITTGYAELGFQHIVKIKSPPEVIANLSSVLQPHAPPQFIDLVGDADFEIAGVAKILDSQTLQIIPGIDIVQWRGAINDIDGDGLAEFFGARNGQINVYDTGKVPVPGINTYTSDYGYRRLYSAIAYDPCPGTYWYSWDEWHTPTTYLITPKNQSSNISQLPLITLYANDSDGDTLTVHWYENTSGTWVLQQTNSSVPANSTVRWMYRNATGSHQKYWWKVTVDDGTHTVSSWFSFTTKVNTPPTCSSPFPSQGATSLPINTATLTVVIHDPEGDPFNWTITTLPNVGGSFGTNATNGTKNCTLTNLVYATTYTWNVNAYDGVYWTNQTYWFTTVSSGEGGGGGEPPAGPQNIKPVANASAGEPYQGFVNSEILFDGSRSSDPDGDITKWFWDFGDSTNGTGKMTRHAYSRVGTYTVTLTVTDNNGTTNTDTTTCVITQRNRPPTNPIITGPTNGTKNTMYIYTALSTDPDNDTIQYLFDWGEPISQSSGFLPNGSSFTVNHSWTSAGRYSVTVTVSDNQTTSSSKITVYIDSIQIGDNGYLTDEDGDGFYDTFYNDTTFQKTIVSRTGSNYLIDSNGDGKWEYTFDAIKGFTPYLPPKTPGFEIIIMIGAIALVMLWKRKRRD